MIQDNLLTLYCAIAFMAAAVIYLIVLAYQSVREFKRIKNEHYEK